MRENIISIISGVVGLLIFALSIVGVAALIARYCEFGFERDNKNESVDTRKIGCKKFVETIHAAEIEIADLEQQIADKQQKLEGLYKKARQLVAAHGVDGDSEGHTHTIATFGSK